MCLMILNSGPLRALLNKPENCTVKCSAELIKLHLLPGFFAPEISYLPSSHFDMPP